MKIGFLGCPASGKTTLAAMLFGALKESGLVVEFIAEEARRHIAQKRFENPDFTLTDQDQAEILQKQAHVEKILCHQNPNLVLTDSSWVNTLGYMSEDFRSETIPSICAEPYDLLFYTPPMDFKSLDDINRVHSFEQSKQIDKGILESLNLLEDAGVPFAQSRGCIVHITQPDLQGRFHFCYSYILDRVVEGAID